MTETRAAERVKMALAEAGYPGVVVWEEEPPDALSWYRREDVPRDVLRKALAVAGLPAYDCCDWCWEHHRGMRCANGDCGAEDD